MKEVATESGSTHGRVGKMSALKSSAKEAGQQAEGAMQSIVREAEDRVTMLNRAGGCSVYVLVCQC